MAGTASVTGGRALAQVQTDPLRLEIADLRLRDRDGNGLLSPGEVALLRFRLNNLGGFTVPGVRAILSADDPTVQIDRPETRFGAVEVGPRAQLLQGEQFPQVSIQEIPKGKSQADMALEVFSGEAQLARREFKLEFAPFFTWSGRLRDEAGAGVEGAKIRISGMNQYSLTTGKDGTFQIELVPGSYHASVYSNQAGSFFEQGYFFDLAADLHFDWGLLPVYPVSGTIRGPQGQALQADIRASASRPSGAYYFGYASSARDGTYTLRLAKGTYTLSAGSSAPEVADRILDRVHVGGPRILDIDLAEAPTAVTEIPTTPATFSLSPNFPNPFNPTTTLRFSLPQRGEAELAIYNLLGQRVATLIKGMQEAGLHQLQWNGQDDQGRALASGVYFYRLQAGAQVETRKLLLLR